MSQTPTITIVVAAYNAERFLGCTLDSVQSQTRQDWECIVVDDGSTDRTAIIAARYASNDARIRVYSQEHTGISAARNLGIGKSHPESNYFCFLDSDDLWLPNSFEILADSMSHHPEAVAAYGVSTAIDAEGNTVDSAGDGAPPPLRLGLRRKRLVALDATAPTTFETMGTHSNITPSGVVLCRKDVVDRCGHFDTQIRHAQDWDLYARMSRHGTFHFVDRVVALYRKHDRNVTRNERLMAYWVAVVRLKIYRSRDNSPAERKILRRGYRALQIYRAGYKWSQCRKGVIEKDLAGLIRLFVGLLVLTVRYVYGRPTRFG